MNLYELTTELAGRRSDRWQTHLRYALHLPGQEMTLPAGTWLLELEVENDNALYRLADGTVVSLDQPLLAGDAKPVGHPEAVRAMASYRSLEQAALENWGVQLEHVDHSAPLRLIKCPLCMGTEFASMDFAQVWCNRCNANFTVRHTAGDPGFVVDCTWEHYSARHAHYLLPRTADFCLTLVLKDSGDLLDRTHSDHCWRDDCSRDQVALTGADSVLRPGLHACAVGTLYGWSLGGRVPVVYDYNRHGYGRLLWPDGGQKRDEEAWPDTAFLRTSNLTREEQNQLRQVARALEKNVDDEHPTWKQALLDAVQDLLARPTRSPHVAFRVPFPDASLLDEGEKYLLHRWLLKRDEGYRLVYAYPVWLVVAAVEDDSGRWRVLQDNICPRCGHIVVAVQPAGDKAVDAHRWCRELWEETGWEPQLSG